MTRDVKIERGIWRTPHGYRIYVWANGRSFPKRLPNTWTLTQVRQYRDEHVVALRRTAGRAAQRGLFADDADRYLRGVAAMPSIDDRRRDIRQWVDRFGHRSRASITVDEIRAELHRWRATLAASTVNHRRTALLHLYTTLDRRGVYNPVREIRPFPEPPPEPRAVPLDTVRSILGVMRPSKTRARLAVLAWTGMRGSQLMRMRPAFVDLEAGHCWVPSGKHGDSHLVALNAEGIAAWREFIDREAWGVFSKDGLRHAFQRACKNAGVSGLRPYDLRHSLVVCI